MISVVSCIFLENHILLESVSLLRTWTIKKNVIYVVDHAVEDRQQSVRKGLQRHRKWKAREKVSISLHRQQSLHCAFKV